MAAAALAVVGFPLGTLVYLRRRRDDWAAEGSDKHPTPSRRRAIEWRGFDGLLRSDFNSEVFWFRHVQLFMHLTLAVSSVMFSDGYPWQQTVRVIVNVFLCIAVLALLVRSVLV